MPEDRKTRARSSDRNRWKTAGLTQIYSSVFLVPKYARATQFARCFKIHSLKRASVSLAPPRASNVLPLDTPSHANLAASAKQSRLVIGLRNVVLCMTNVCQARNVSGSPSEKHASWPTSRTVELGKLIEIVSTRNEGRKENSLGFCPTLPERIISLVKYVK